MPKITVITSETGHNLHALLDAHQTQNLKDGEITLVVSSDENALRAAQKAGIDTLAKPDDDAELLKQVATHKPDLIVALDTPHGLNADFLKKFSHQIIAAYPALAGQFTDNKPIDSAFKAFQKNEIKWTGCHVHYVDSGETMRQLVVPIEPKESMQRFAARMRKGENWLLLKGVKQYLYELRNRNKRSTTSQSET